MPEETEEEKKAREAREAEAARNRTFTQEEVNRLCATEKRDGRRIREEEILKDLGVDSLDAAKEKIASAEKAEADALSATEKAQKEAEAEKTKAAAERSTLQADRRAIAGERALLAAGLVVPEDDKENKTLTRALRLLELGDGEPDPATIAAAVDELKTDVPSFFAPAKEGQEPPKPGVAPSDTGKPPAQPSVSDAQKQATSILHQRHPQLVRKSTD